MSGLSLKVSAVRDGSGRAWVCGNGEWIGSRGMGISPAAGLALLDEMRLGVLAHRLQQAIARFRLRQVDLHQGLVHQLGQEVQDLEVLDAQPEYHPVVAIRDEDVEQDLRHHQVLPEALLGGLLLSPPDELRHDSEQESQHEALAQSLHRTTLPQAISRRMSDGL